MAKERGLKMVDEQSTTVLERDAEFEGKLTFEGTVHLNGKFRGEIFSEGTLIVGEDAHVEANIDVGTVIVSGSVEGSIFAKQKIEILNPAQVVGDIHSPALVVSEGALFEGQCSMGKFQRSVPQEEEQPVTTQAEVFELSSQSDNDRDDLGY